MKRAEVALFALVFGAFAYFYQAGGWNQNVRFDLSRAMVEDHLLVIDRLAYNSSDLAKKDGHFFCDKAPGVSLAGAVPLFVVETIAGPPRSITYLTWASWLSILFAIALPSALGVVALALLLGALGMRAPPRFALAAAWGLATLALPYSTLYYGHQLVASILIIAFAMVVRIARGVDAPTKVRLIAIGAIGGLAIVVEYPAALAALAIGVYALRKLGWKQTSWIALGGVAPALVLVWYHTVAFGAPWHLPYDYSIYGNRSAGFFMGIGVPKLRPLWGITFSSFRGLFYSAPWLLLAIPGGVRMWRRGFRDETIVCAAIAILFVWMNASLIDWDGGSAVGPRYIVPCIPFLVVLVGGLALPPEPRAPRAARAIVALVFGVSAFLMLAATAVQPEIGHTIPSPFADVVLPKLARGEVAVSTQSIDMGGLDKKGTRYAWNLGEQLGFGGLFSLAPLLVWCGAWSWILARRARATK